MSDSGYSRNQYYQGQKPHKDGQTDPSTGGPGWPQPPQPPPQSNSSEHYSGPYSASNAGDRRDSPHASYHQPSSGWHAHYQPNVSSHSIPTSQPHPQSSTGNCPPQPEAPRAQPYQYSTGNGTAQEAYRGYASAAPNGQHTQQQYQSSAGTEPRYSAWATHPSGGEYRARYNAHNQVEAYEYR